MKLLSFLLAITFVVSSGSFAAESKGNIYGHVANEGTASRTIKITPRTRAINVHDGETVRFDVDGKTFEWTFDLPSREGVISFSDIEPSTTGAGTVRIYVAPNPLYYGS